MSLTRFGRPVESQWQVIFNGPEGVVIKDIGVTSVSVTNDAEAVVAKLADLLGPRRLFYFDSMGQLDEILVRNGQFAGFAAGAPADIRRALGIANEPRREK